ncbi:MAG TPA: radical SAM family heme chaperone HemW [Fimbriiglobus sp.]|jgi:oxygen-independent coproporphyrinogen-3 oxidase
MAPPWLEPRTAYIHVPFCGHHCGYCDFAVTAGQDFLIELYLDALEIELQSLATPRPVESLFIGGGTPTYLNPDQLGRLLESIRRWLPPQSGTADKLEYSIESTPESLDEEKTSLLASFGVSRISVGVQSFRAQRLSALDRRHGVEHISRAIEAVRHQRLDLSLDLIFAAPGATLDEWQSDLKAAVGFNPDHLSTYGLTYEKGTPIWKDRASGRVRPVTEDVELAMYEAAIVGLTESGYEQYEISNFARPGKRCRHNERYWANEAYYGFGVGAARYVRGVRELNVRNTNDYVKRILGGESPTFQSETLPPRDRAVETMAVQLRRCDGIERSAFRIQTEYELDELIGKKLPSLVSEGLITDDGHRIRLTRRGLCVADGIIESLMAAAG